MQCHITLLVTFIDYCDWARTWATFTAHALNSPSPAVVLSQIPCLFSTQSKIWTLTSLSPTEKIRGCKWGFTVLQGTEGDMQCYSVTLALQRRLTEIRGRLSWNLWPGGETQPQKNALERCRWVSFKDVTTTFLHGETIALQSIEQPQVFVSRKALLVSKHGKELCGLRQAGRAWDKKLF